jgi:hypothetical protein
MNHMNLAINFIYFSCLFTREMAGGGDILQVEKSLKKQAKLGN